MSDITKCHGRNCNCREFCYRFTAIPNPYAQAYANFDDTHDTECEAFYGNELYAQKPEPKEKE